MTNSYVNDLKEDVYRLDAMLAVARLNKNSLVAELFEGYLEEALSELKQAEHMQEVANGKANRI